LSQRIGLLLGYDDTILEGEGLEPSVHYQLVDALPPSLTSLRIYGYMEGANSAIDEQVAELIEKKTELFPKLATIEGVDELLPGVPGTWGPEPDEDDVWERPAENLDWVAI
jgi:hypothetical protein